MRLTIETESYNSKRYGKPWIAKINFEDNKQGNFFWGEWVGESGEEGMLILENVEVGDIISRGQRDNRKMSNSAPNFYIVREGLELERVSKIEAYKHWMQKRGE